MACWTACGNSRLSGSRDLLVAERPPWSQVTLVSSYLDARKFPCLWYQIDEGDTDPATFFYYLGMAAKKASPRKRKSLPLLTPEYLQGIATFTFRYFEELYNRLIPPYPPLEKGGFIIVFDNYHEVPADSSFHEIILNGLSRIPEGINVILISRSKPSSAFIRLRANHQLEVLGWSDLRLTLEESKGIVRLRAQQRQVQDTISLLHKAS